MDKTNGWRLYLWQGIIIYVVILVAIFSVGQVYKDRIISWYYSHMYAPNELNPVSPRDQLMIALENKIRENPANPNDYLQLGWIYYQKGEPREAIKVYLMALNLEPDHAGALYNLGLIYAGEGNLPKAEYYFNKVLAKHPDHEQAGLALVRLYYDAARYEDADRVLAGFDLNYVTSADFFYYRGLVAEKLDRPKEAEAAFRKALAFDPEFQDAKARLAELRQ